MATPPDGCSTLLACARRCCLSVTGARPIGNANAACVTALRFVGARTVDGRRLPIRQHIDDAGTVRWRLPPQGCFVKLANTACIDLAGAGFLLI